MKTYKTLITVRGLRRADPMRAREPIGEGEVISLPEGYARSLRDVGAIEETDAEVTVELDWKPPVTLVKSDDRERLIEALAALGVNDLPIMPATSVTEPVGIRPTDAEALAQALEALGATVLLPGEGLVGRDLTKFVVALKNFGATVTLPGEAVALDNVLLRDLMGEISARVRFGSVAATDLPESVIGLAATMVKVPEASLEVATPAAVAEPLPPPTDTPPPAPAPTKPARKGKA